MPSDSKKKDNSSENVNKNNSNSSDRNGCSSRGSRARKRKRCEIVISEDSDLESELDCNLEDAIAIEKKLRKVAKDNDLSNDEMRKLLQKFVKNEHILALVTLKAEDELARERKEAEQPAIIITDIPSVPKLTRAKARELNKTPRIALPSLTDTNEPEFAALIKEDLHSDDEDEEYIFKEEDFISDDDPNTTASDIDSNPRTPQTPMSQTDAENSPLKFTADGCFKIPLEKNKSTRSDFRIATRTRSKLCLQQTTIEDIESEFVPPDVEHSDIPDSELTVNDRDWMQFLNDFTKPLNSNFITDDDDPINDPEYIAADKIPEDAEELRDVNIPKKELTELVAELFEGLLNEGVSLESIELDTPQKFDQNQTNNTSIAQVVDNSLQTSTNIAGPLNFESPTQPQNRSQFCVEQKESTYGENEYYFQPNVMSTPALTHTSSHSPTQVIPVAYTTDQSNSICQTISLPTSNLNIEPDWIAVKIPGQPNTYQLARVVAHGNALEQSVAFNSPEKALTEQVASPQNKMRNDPRYNVPYDNNFTWEYISIKKHVYTEYHAKFEGLRYLPPKPKAIEELSNKASGFTQHQHDILQQQLRIHVQLLTQTFLQTFSHPTLWKMAPKVKEMLKELHEKSKGHATYNAWNLERAVALVAHWEDELNKDTPENKEMMNFINKEVELTNRNTRQIPRFAPRIMDVMLNSEVFMYPQYLPRIPFTPKTCSFEIFAPAEAQLIAMGLEKHITKIRQTGEKISKKLGEVLVACNRLSKDTVFGKTKRRIWDHIKVLRKADYYNPVKYFFEHNCAPPLEHNLLTFQNNTVLPPKLCYANLPLAWQSYLDSQNQESSQTELNNSPPKKVSREARLSYLEVVREALGEDLQLPENFPEAAEPDDSASYSIHDETHNRAVRCRKQRNKRSNRAYTINVNYIFGSTTPDNSAHSNLDFATTSTSQPAYNTSTINLSNLDNTPLQYNTAFPTAPSPSSVVSFNYDCSTQTLCPVVELHEKLDTISNTTRAVQNKFVPLRRKLFSQRYPFKFQRLKSCRNKHIIARRHRIKKKLAKHCVNLLSKYHQHLEQEELQYAQSPLVRRYYRYFKALELYSDLLIELKMTCRNAGNSALNDMVGDSTPSFNAGSARAFSSGTQLFGKRTRSQLAQQQALEDEASIARTKRTSRQEESFRNMLLPDSAEDANRKDAIYAFNFYEKAEEAFKSSNRPDDCKRFNQLLKSFDPRRDKVADLYYNMEQLFLPEHPELAEVFLTFLLPSEAAEIGKFFEHFMVNNMCNFVNKLNIYFNKQPAQMRKIYNCLNELAEDPDVTVKKVEAKILPLLKGNQFLVDWFLQQFPEGQPPDRLFAAPEIVNLKEVQSNGDGEFYETIIDPLESPTSNEQSQPLSQPTSCQLKYINGRIFYGNKMTLPAKLSFMATNYQPESSECLDAEQQPMECVHGIREHGERRLATAAANAALADCNSDDNEKCEDDDFSKDLIIDTTAEDDNSSSMETCDDATLRSHAIRLNPSYYSNTCFVPITSTPNPTSNQQPIQSNPRKSSLNFNDEGKISPRKQIPTQSAAPNNSPAQISSPNTSLNTATAAAALLQLREKRKSPTKKVKSPVGSYVARSRNMSLQPMVVVHEQKAIACAKKLKSLIEEENECDIDNKERLTIVASAKYTFTDADSGVNDANLNEVSPPHASGPMFLTKVECGDSLSDMEFLPEHEENVQANRLGQEISNQYCSHEEVPEMRQVTPMESDEECKLDVVATLATSETSDIASYDNKTNSSVQCREPTAEKVECRSNVAWTRHEDKLILVEMKLNVGIDRASLYERIQSKLPERSIPEIISRHQFLLDFLSKLQGK